MTKRTAKAAKSEFKPGSAGDGRDQNAQKRTQVRFFMPFFQWAINIKRQRQFLRALLIFLIFHWLLRVSSGFLSALEENPGAACYT
ncbi:hypothetical protein ACP3S8_02095 [Mixta calida]|uniref:hypothetical protein n=1 Tax=Mixta calida TaxID=665913 RepID=UPI003CE929F6